MSVEEFKSSSIPPTFVDNDHNGKFIGMAIARTPQQAEAIFARQDEYFWVWMEKLARGEKIGPVITNPSKTTPAEAVQKDTIDPKTGIKRGRSPLHPDL
jgi:hypothetical protein